MDWDWLQMPGGYTGRYELTGMTLKMTVGQEVAQRVYAAIDEAGQRGIVEFLDCTFAITACDISMNGYNSYQIELQMIEAGSQLMQETTKSRGKLAKHVASEKKDPEKAKEKDQDHDIEEALTAMRISVRGA